MPRHSETIDHNTPAHVSRTPTPVPAWWRTHGTTVLRAAVVIMAIAAGVWLAYEFWRLLLEAPPRGPMDLRYRMIAAHEWFAGRPVYREHAFVLDPPATQVLLWPVLGWMNLAAAQWLWAATSIAALVWTSVLAVRHSGATTSLERGVMGLLPFSMYASGATIGNGQIGVHLLPVLLSGCLLMAQRISIGRAVAGAALVLVALAKPSLSAPFFWIVLFVPRTRLPAILTAAGYAAVTMFAAAFQQDDLITLLRQSLARESAMAVRPVPGNVANLHIWLGSLGLESWILPTSLAVLAALGLWIFRHRRSDIWLLLGVTGYVSRFWSYHRWYDDGLILLPMIALMRLAKGAGGMAAPGRWRVISGVLLAVTIASTIAPGGLFLFPPPFNMWYVRAQVIVWLAGLVFLALGREMTSEVFLRTGSFYEDRKKTSEVISRSG